MANSAPHNDRPMVGLKLPKGYTVQRLNTANGLRFRAVNVDWFGVVRHQLVDAEDDAWTHFYVTHGARPHLRVTQAAVTDVLTGHSVMHKDVRIAGSYAGAFRLRAERMRYNADKSNHKRLWETSHKIADVFEEIAQRLEVRRVHDQVDK